MAERFRVLFQNGFFKILDAFDRKVFVNYCQEHKGKMGVLSIEDGFRVTIDENGEIDNFWDKVGERNKEEV